MNLNKMARYAIIIIIIVISAIHLPKFYTKLLDKKQSSPKISYSPVLDKFVYYQYTGNKMKCTDFDGNIYARKEYEKLLPFMFFRDLSKWGVLPDIIKGLPIDIQTIHHNSTRYRLRTKDLDLPEIKLYPLFESESDFANLMLPSDVFRITNKIEFIKASDNKVNTSKSEKFNQVFVKEGFAFPAKLVAGNPTTRKPFDEGYFIVDSKDNVYHLKMKKGKPFFVKTSIPNSIKIRKIIFQENQIKKIYGYLLSEEGEIYTIDYDNYQIKKIELKNYDVTKNNLRITVDPLYNIYNYSDGITFHCAVYDTNYNFIDYVAKSIPAKEEKITEKIKHVIFPFSIITHKSTSSLKQFGIKFHSMLSIIGILISLIIGFLMKVKRNEDIKANWPDFILLLLTGIYGLIGVLLIKSDTWD